MKLNEQFLDDVEDFLEKGAERNNFTYAISKNKKIHILKSGAESLILVNHPMSENGILNGTLGALPNGFIKHVLSTLQIKYLED